MIVDASLKSSDAIVGLGDHKIRVLSCEFINGATNGRRKFLKYGMTDEGSVVVEIPLIKF